MNLKYKIITVIVVLATTFAAGRYSVPSQSKKIVETTTEAKKDIEIKAVHTKKTVVETKKPDGTITFITTVDQTVGDTKTETDAKKEILQETTKDIRKTFNISVIGANDFSRSPALTYGLSVSKEVLAPITIGAFGLRNGVIGLSIGLDF